MQSRRILFSLIVLFSLLVEFSFATHFRFGTISWRIPDATKPNVVQFYSSFTFRRSFFGTPNVGSTINVGSFTFGDGSASVPLLLLISSIDTKADWASGTFTTTKTYAANVAKNYTAGHTSAGRILELNNNPNQNWNVTCTVSVLQYVTDSNGNRVLNTAPVSNNLPIVSVYSSEVNTFRVTAQDPEGQTLTYSLGTPRDMGGNSLTLAPKLTVSTDGIVTFNTVGVKDGYWCTQIKFTDGLSYAVVDFLIFIAPRPMFCDSRCTNGGASCTADSGCNGCTTSARCVTAQAPYFVNPVDGSSLTVITGINLSFNWTAFTPNDNLTITSSSLPTGSVVTGNPVGSGYVTQFFSWTPTTAAVGVYVITLGCVDSTDQACQQTSVSIAVVAPYCGTGTIRPAGCNPSWKNCTCSCPTGFDPSSLCYDCLPGYYGSSCTACPTPCVNGICNDGISGVGGCTCHVGWQGSSCSTPQNKPCSLTTPSYIVSNVSTGTYLNPNTYIAYFSTPVAVSSLSLPLVTRVSAVPAKLDILLLVDVTKSITTAMLAQLSDTYARNFFTNVRNVALNSYFAIASFTDSPQGTGCSSSDYTFRLHLPLDSDMNDFQTTTTGYFKPTALGCDDTVSKNDAQLNALVGAASSSVGWRTDAYHVVILVTDSPFWEGGIYASRSDVQAALTAANIIPIILTPSGVQSTYTSLITSLGFGVNAAVLADYTNVYSSALTQLQSTFGTLWTAVQDDQYGFVTSVSAKQTFTPPANRSSVVNMAFPQAYLNTFTTFPTVVVNTMGWGSTSIVAQMNRVPIPSVCSVVTLEDVSTTIPISANDPDGNGLSVIVTQLPSRGILYTNSSNSGSRVVSGTSYTLPNGNPASPFYYTPALHVYGTDSFSYVISDGCAQTVTVSCVISITFRDYPPVAYDFSTSTMENVAITVAMNGTDVETLASGLVFTITQLPDPNLGVLKRLNGNNVVINELFAAGENSVQFVPVTYACCDIAQFTYQVYDSARQVSNLVTGAINIIGVNQQPVASATNPTANRGATIPIVLNVWDPDKNDQETFKITSYTVTYGSLTTAASVAFGATPITLGTVSVGTATTASMTVYYTAPVNAVGANAASFTFTVTDATGSVSTPVTVTIGINTVNRAPTANPAGPILVFQDASSNVWNLNGTDLDAVDANSLIVQITSLPTKGTLTQYTVGDISSSSLPLTLTNPNVVYRTNARGTDAFTFRVVDNLGAMSADQPVSVVITPVNHQPTVTFSPVTTNEDVPLVIQINPYDSDGNIMTVYIATLPTKGTFYQFTSSGPGAQIAAGAALTDSQFRFYFIPVQYENGSPYTTFTFYVNDNQGESNSQSATVAGTINVIAVNNPPVPTAFTVTLNENDSPKTFTFAATDVDNTQAELSFYMTSLPQASLGAVTDIAGNPIAVSAVIPNPGTVRFAPVAYKWGTTTFSFGANDGQANSITLATVTVVVNHVNQRPTMTSTSPITASRSVGLGITLIVSEYDIGDTETVKFTAQTGGGTLSYNNVPVSVGSALPATFTIPASGSLAITGLTYLAPPTATPGANYDRLSFTVTDQDGLTSTTVVVSVTIAQNRIPVASPASIQVTQDFFSAATTLSGTDADVADANVLSVIITALPTKGTLYLLPGNTSISSTGSISTTSTAQVTYFTNQRGVDQFTYVVQDLLLASSTAVTVPVTITNTNHAPSAFWVGTATADEDTPLIITQMRASDPDGDAVTIYVSQPGRGTIKQYNDDPCTTWPCRVMDSQNRMKFTTPQYDNGVPYTTFQFTASDGSLSSAPATGTLNINPVNNAPVATGGTFPTDENVNKTFILIATDVDNTPQQVTIRIMSLPTLGRLVYNNAVLQFGSVISTPYEVTFVPTRYAFGSTSFTFNAFDGSLTSGTATVNIPINHVNQIPVCSTSPADAFLVRNPSSTTVELTAFDPDPAEALTFTITRFDSLSGGQFFDRNNVQITSAQVLDTNVAPSTSTMVGSTAVTFTASFADSSAYLYLEFTVTDSSNAVSGVCSLTFNSSQNDPPTTNPSGPYTLFEDGISDIIHINGSDPEGGQLRVYIVDLPQNGVLLQGSDNRTITSPNSPLDPLVDTVYYRPNPLFHSQDSFTFIVRDPPGAYSSPKERVSLSVTHVNHPPTIIVSSSTVTTLEDTNITITQISASDVDGDTVTVEIQAAPSRGTLSQTNGAPINTFPASLTAPFHFIYTPVPDGNGSPYTSVDVYAFDGAMTSTTTENIVINVLPVDDPPVSQDNVVPLNEITPTSSPSTFTIALHATDVDTADADISAVILSLPSSAYGVLTNTTGGAIKVGDAIPYPREVLFAPVPYTFGNTEFSFKAQDLTSLSSNTGAVSINITHVNHNPITSNVELTAVRGSPLTITLTATDPDAADTFSFSMEDSHNIGTSFEVAGTPLTTNGVFASGIVNTLTRTFSTSLTYDTPITASGTNFSTLWFKVTDNGGLSSDIQQISISITPNSEPVATPTSITVIQDQVSPAATLNGTDADPVDANTLTVVITTRPTKGTLILPGGVDLSTVPHSLPQGSSVTYTTTQRGSDSFAFHVVDNLGSASGDVLVPITITPVNHPPTASISGTIVTAEDTNVTITQISVADPDGDAVSVIISALPEQGILSQFDGTPITTVPTNVTDARLWLIFTPPADANGSPFAQFSFYADDGQALDHTSANLTGTIDVTPVNDPPFAINGVTQASENDPPITITLNVSDIDTPLASVYVYLTSLPNATIGTLYDGNNVPIQLNTPIPTREVTLQLVQYAHGTTTFTFVANDGALDSQSSATQTIIIASVNQAPTASASTPINVARGLSGTIKLQTFDPDYPESFTFSVDTYSATGGYFSYGGAEFSTISATTPFALVSNVPKSNSGNFIEVNFTAPDDQYGNAFAQVALTVTDADGVASNVVPVAVNVLLGAEPIATPVSTITFAEETSSAVVTLSGTDTDVVDADRLRVIIASLPSKAVLVQKGANGAADTDITSVGTVLSNPQVYLRGNTLTYGTDSFSFVVKDLVNLTSTPSVVDVVITHVNHPPTAGVSITNGVMNTKLMFAVFGQDPDNDSPLYIYVSALPAVGTLCQADGTAFPASTSETTPTLVTDFNGKLMYIPPTNGYGFPLANISFYVDDNSGWANSKSALVTPLLNITQVDLPPTAANLTAVLPQNSQGSLVFTVADPQNYALSSTILTFPTAGTLFRSDGTTPITPSAPTTDTDNTVVYVPAFNGFDDGKTPYATFTYAASSATSGLSSNIAQVIVWVNRTFPNPVFTGATVYTIQDNTNLSMLLTGQSAANSYSILIINTIPSDKGLLFTRNCMGDEGCMTTYATDNFVMDDANMENRLRYTPPQDKYGMNFTVFTVQVIDMYGRSDPVNITINIYHINIPPVVVPRTYNTNGATFNWSNAIVNVIEGNSAVIAWAVTDKDTPPANLSSIIFSLPYRGSVFACTETTSGFVAGAAITKLGTVVNASSDGLFRVVYAPTPGQSGQNYATFSIVAYDKIDQSTRTSLKINVKHINLPPSVGVEIPNWNTTSDSQIIVTGVSVNDSDASFYPMMFRLTLATLDLTPVAQSDGYIDLITYNPKTCFRASNVTLNCTSTLTDLNKMLQQISIDLSVVGSYTIIVFVDDLGAGAEASERAYSHLNATGSVYVNVVNDETSLTSKPPSSSTMTAAIAASAGAATAAAVGIWRFAKKRMPPTGAFFGQEGLDSAVTDNPLYEDHSATFENALYESATA